MTTPPMKPPQSPVTFPKNAPNRIPSVNKLSVGSPSCVSSRDNSPTSEDSNKILFLYSHFATEIDRFRHFNMQTSGIQKCGWDPEYPEASSEPAFSTIGVNLLRHRILENDQVLAKILGYCGSYQLDLHISAAGKVLREEDALLEALCAAPNRQSYETDEFKRMQYADELRPFLEMNMRNRRFFLKQMTPDRFHAFYNILQDYMSTCRPPVRLVHRIFMLNPNHM